MPHYAIAPLAVTRRDTYTYRFPKALGRGQVVQVPYARSERTGVVLGPADADPRAVAIIRVLPERLPDWQVRFAETLAARCLAPLGQTVGLLLPPWSEGKAATDIPPLRSPRPTLLLEGDPWPRYAKETGDAAGQILVLVPEARLTRTRLPGAIPFTATLPIARRREVWEHVRRNPRAVVVGTRSALFLPWRKLAAVIVDQEDELGHLNDRTPRYHAREAALLLAARHGARLILSSLSPSLRAWMLAGWPKFPEPSLASPDVLDTRNVPTRTTIPHGIPERILEAPGEVLLHTVTRNVPLVRAAIDRTAPGARVRVGGQPALFSDRRYALVIALDFDALLSRPGYAVTERAVSLARKLAARLVPGGRLLIPTAHPDHPALGWAAKPYGSFLAAELEERKHLGLPPAGPLVRIETERTDEPKVREGLERAGVPDKRIRSTHADGRTTVLVKWDPRRLRALLAPERRISVDY